MTISPAQYLSVSISDASGATVMTATIESFEGSNPNGLISWTCSRRDYAQVNESGFGNVIESLTIDADGNLSITRQTASGLVLSTTDAAGNVSTIQYDPAGRVKQVRDANGVGFDYVYDELGQFTSRTDTIVYRPTGLAGQEQPRTMAYSAE